MGTLAIKAQAWCLRYDADNLWVELSDGRQLGVPLAYFPRLLSATPAERERYVISGGGTGLHWEDLDEDISVEGLLQGIPDRTRRYCSIILRELAELFEGEDGGLQRESCDIAILTLMDFPHGRARR